MKEELSELIVERRGQTSELQGRIKRQNSFQSTMEKTRAMLQLIDQDIQHWKNEVEQGQANEKTSIDDALLLAFYLAFLSQFNIDQRQQLFEHWTTNFLTIRMNFNLLEILHDEKGFSSFSELKMKTRKSFLFPRIK